MKWARPKSLTSLMLLGLALIAGPLLVAVVDAAIQIRSLTRDSQLLVNQGVQAARTSQSMLTDITSLRRSVSFYQVTGNASYLENYRKTDQQLAASRAYLAQLLNSQTMRRSLDDFAAMHNEIASAVGALVPGSTAFPSILDRIDRLAELANDIVASGSKEVDVRLVDMQRLAQSTQKRLFWQSALLVPLTLIAILALTLSI